MPIFSYRCTNGHEFERLEIKAEDKPKSCIECGAPIEQIPAVPSRFQWGKSGGWQ